MIKMRVNKSKQSVCDECGTEFMDTLEMYDIMFVSEMYTVCYDCANTLFHKLLKADCLYNGKLKDKDDQIRSNRYHAIKNKDLITHHISINEENGNE